MQRKIFFDTETTGLSPEKGDRVIQIGLVEMIDGKISNQKEYFLNPEGKKSARGAFEVHGIKDSFLLNQPKFSDIADEFLASIKGAELYAHNAAFDIDMINNELRLIGKSERIDQICKVTDTIDLVRKKLPITRYKLDVVMKHLKIDYSQKRDYHSALEDSIILAKVYLAMHKTEKNLFSGIEDESNNFINQSNHPTISSSDSKTDSQQSLNNQLDLVLSPISAQEIKADASFFETAKQKTIRDASV